MKNNRGFSLLSVDMIERAVTSEPEVMEAVLRRYARYIQRLCLVGGRIDADMEERLRAKLMSAVLKFRAYR